MERYGHATFRIRNPLSPLYQVSDLDKRLDRRSEMLVDGNDHLFDGAQHLDGVWRASFFALWGMRSALECFGRHGEDVLLLPLCRGKIVRLGGLRSMNGYGMIVIVPSRRTCSMSCQIVLYVDAKQTRRIVLRFKKTVKRGTYGGLIRYYMDD